MKDEFLSDEDLDLRNLSEAELEAYWDIWFRQAQSTNDQDAHLYSHGVFLEEPHVEPFPPRPSERRVLDFIVDGTSEVLVALRAQLADVHVKRRSLTTTGFWLEFEVPGADRAIPGRPSFRIIDVHADVRGLERGMGFVLWIRDGLATELEGFTHTEDLPFLWELTRLVYVESLRSLDPLVVRPPGGPR